MSNQTNIEPTIGEIVANDFRAASLFKEAGIDFCCGGNKSLSAACKEKGADESHLVRQLETLALTPVNSAMNFKEWDLSFLSDYIMNTHHKFVLKNEEEVLFPAIKEAEKNATAAVKSTIVSEITRMQDEHEFAGGAMDTINVLTNNYLIPEDACNTYRVSLKLLEQFEDDLHIHVHLENNILYPRALKLAE